MISIYAKFYLRTNSLTKGCNNTSTMSSRSKQTSVNKGRSRKKSPIRKRKVSQSKNKSALSGITNASIGHILKRAGVVRQGKGDDKSATSLPDVVRTDVDELMNTLVGAAVKIAKYDGRKTLMEKDVRAALSLHGIDLTVGLAKKVDRTDGLKGRRGTGKKYKKVEGDKKPRRAKPGKAAAREIKREQKNSDHLNFPKVAFDRLVKDVSKHYTDKNTAARVSVAFVLLLQLAVEDYLVKLVTGANKLSKHAGRQTLFIRDYTLAKDVSNNILRI